MSDPILTHEQKVEKLLVSSFAMQGLILAATLAPLRHSEIDKDNILDIAEGIRSGVEKVML